MRQTQNLRSGSWRIKTDDLTSHFNAQENFIHQPLPDDAGIGYSNIFNFDEDLSYIETSYTPSKNLCILNQVDTHEPRIVVTIGLKGHSRFCDQKGEVVSFDKGYTSIATFNSSIGERQYEANKAITQLRLSMNKKWLDRHFGENKFQHLFTKNGLKQLSHRPISHQGISAAQQLLKCNVSKEVKQLFMQGQAMTLLATELSPLCADETKGSTCYKAKDQKIALLAQDILQAEFKNPPSVEELSRRVGVNQFKLKQLFHAFFNNTPYGLLLDIRMQKAYELLEKTRCHVNIAADFVGYSHASNFSAAFIKYYGVSPKIISKDK